MNLITEDDYRTATDNYFNVFGNLTSFRTDYPPYDDMIKEFTPGLDNLYKRLEMFDQDYVFNVKCGIEVLNHWSMIRYGTCTVKQLKQRCKENNLKGYSKLKRAELLKLLMTI